MALTLVTNPVGAASSKIFAGLKPIEFIFKREDIAIISITSGTNSKAKITHAGDLTTYLQAGDAIYVYSEGTGFTYDTTGIILTIVAGEITIDVDYVVSGTGGYMNYFKNYFVELQCVRDGISDANILPFSLESDGDAAGNIKIDVSVINDLNSQRGAIATGQIDESIQEFEVKYKQVYDGSTETFTLVDNKLLIVLYCIDVPNEEEILNEFSMPRIYLGYPGALTIAHKEGVASSTIEMIYNEKDINKNNIKSGTLGTQANDVNGFLQWLWSKNTTVESATKYIEFALKNQTAYDFAASDFDYPDFKTQ